MHKNNIIVIMLLLFIPFLHAQEMKPVILPTATDEVLAIIRYAVQGIRQNRADMVIAQWANRVYHIEGEKYSQQVQLRIHFIDHKLFLHNMVTNSLQTVTVRGD